jgi:hypothetical protein
VRRRRRKQAHGSCERLVIAEGLLLLEQLVGGDAR